MEKTILQEMFSDKDLGTILFDEPMKNHTSFKIGGAADVLIIPTDIEKLIEAIKICREKNIHFYIMGNGSNLLVRDGGMRGVVIKICEGINRVEVRENLIHCEAGALLTGVSRTAMDHSLTGFEFANGIPGTIGGAVTMNAGAYGGEMKDVIKSVKVLDSENNVLDYTNEEMNFRYRGSRVVDDSLIVLSIELELSHGDHQTISETMKDLTHKRTSKQPLELPSAGSTFKRPEGYFAGKLIEDSGLRGARFRGAQVSEKHCGFIVNIDNASCKDVLSLIKVVQKTVRDNYNVELETEVKIIGED